MINIFNAKKYSSIFISAMMLIALLLAFWVNTSTYEFLNLDDETFITKNPVIADTDKPIGELLHYKLGEPDYFPLSFLFWRFMNEVFGLNPFVFHLANVLLHLVNVLLVFFLSLKIIERFGIASHKLFIAFGIAAVFSIHPVHVESVAWLICLKDMLFALFYIAGILFWLKWRDTSKKHFYWFAVLAGFFSLLSKSMGITFIGVIVMLDLLEMRRINLKYIIQIIPLLLFTVFGFWIFGLLGDPFNTFNIEKSVSDVIFQVHYPESIDGFSPFLKTVFIASFRIIFWFKQMILPVNQTVFYSRETLLESVSGILLFFPFILLVLAVVIFLFRKKNPLLWFGFLFFSITISPALAHADYAISTFVPDRYLYLPVFGFLFMLASLFMQVKLKWAVPVLLVFTMFWAVKTLRYLPVWKNSETLYNYVLNNDRYNKEALLNRSVWYLHNNEEEKGMQDIDFYIENFPKSPSALINRAKYHFLNEEFEKAVNDYSLAIALDSGNVELYIERGVANMNLKKYQESRIDFSKAYTMDSMDFLVNKNIAMLYYQVQNYSVAKSFSQIALNLKPNDMEMLKIEAISMVHLKEYQMALNKVDALLKIDENMGEMWFHRSLIHFMLKKFEQAKHDYDISKELEYESDENYWKMLDDSLSS